jgi:hypothetical protein
LHLVRRDVAGRGHQLEGEIGDEKRRQKRLSGHEENDDRRRQPIADVIKLFSSATLLTRSTNKLGCWSQSFQSTWTKALEH